MIKNTRSDQSIEQTLSLVQFSMDCAKDAIFWLGKDARFFYANSAACRMLGYSRQEFLTMTVHDIDLGLSTEKWEQYWADLKQLRSLTLETQHQAKNGCVFPTEVTAHYLELDGVEYGCAFIHDIAERKLTEFALRESEERFRYLMEGAADAFFLHDLEGRIIDVNQQACITLGYSHQELLNLSIQDIEQDWGSNVLWQELLPGQPITVNSTHQCKDGTTFPVETRLSAIDLAGARLILALARDVSERTRLEAERERAREQLRRYAFYDTPTGLPNRTFLLERLGQILHEDNGDQFALVCFSLDRFEPVKYSFGHSVGERLLLAAIQRIVACLPASALIARIESGEFAILLQPLINLNQATHLAEQLQKELTNPFRLNGHEVFTTASIGIVLSSVAYEQPMEFLRAADIAMHRASTGKTIPYVLFNEEMQIEAVRRLELDADLRRALQRNEFQLHYQPIVSLPSQQLVGLEALVRWYHPQRGIVSPGEFMPLAEETELIVPLGLWVLRQACFQFVQWQKQFPLTAPEFISVNLSAIQLRQPELPHQIDQILREAGLHPNCLKLEITESAAMENAERVVQILQQLKARQIRLSIDDFGTGYSSLSYLHSFPVDSLKIDRSFINQIEQQSKNLEIICTTVKLAHGLGMEAIAEGIETEQQLDYLNSLGCEYGQGYLFAKPLNADGITALLERVTQIYP
jgi:PAS domain S-box-containing protein/diguanylate cyclase (GGDEF)-like protein